MTTAHGPLLVEALAGSHLYNLATETSDLDLRGVALEPAAGLIGLASAFEQLEEKEPADRVIYGLRKFIRLALANNPNILDIAFAPPETWRVSTPTWEAFYRMRHKLLSQRVRRTFGGYALQSLRGLQAGRSTSGEARRPLIEQFGFDVKDGSALVRLLFAAQRILRDGDYNPRLEGNERSILMDIRRGGWAQADVIQYGEELLVEMDAMETALPLEPDPAPFEALVMGVYRQHFAELAA